MAAPLSSSKATVDLKAPGVKGSRIRRDPPHRQKEISLAERNERDLRAAIFGIVLFTLAVVAILIGVASMTGWTPRAYTLRF